MVLLPSGWVHLNSLVHNYDFPSTSRGSQGAHVMMCGQRDLEGSKEGRLLLVCGGGGGGCSEGLMGEVTFEVRLKGWEHLMGR